MGAIAEQPKPGATIGETFSCIIGKSKSDTKKIHTHISTSYSAKMRLYRLQSEKGFN